MTTQNIYADSRVFEEFSPKKLVLQIREAGSYIFSKWLAILLIGFGFGLVGTLYYYFKDPTYTAEVTFTLDEDVSQPARTGLNTLSEELGFESAVNPNPIFRITNIEELIQSRLLIEKTLRTAATIDGKPILFVDFFLDSLEYRDDWMKGPYHRLDFSKPKTDKNEIRFESGIIKAAYETLTAKNIKVNQKGKGTTVIAVTCTSEHELFSKYFLEALLNEVTHYYVESKTRRAKNNLELIQKRTDSIRLAYNSALYGRAAFMDAHVNPGRQIASISGEKQQTDVQILRASYVELVRTLEAAKTGLMRETPLIQYLDTPILPLKVNKPSLLKRFLVFSFIGAFLAMIFFLTRRTYRYIVLAP